VAKKVSNTELNDTFPVETSEDTVKKMAAAPAAPKPLKTRLKETTTDTDDTPPDYAALGIADEKVGEFEELRLQFKELGRRSTTQVFECGEVVHKLEELAPDQEGFAKLSKAVFGLSRTGAENYSRVHRYLQPYRARLVKVAMIASGLYSLATAEPGKIEEVLAARETGEKLTLKQINAMIGKEASPSASPDDGGLAGLRAAAAEKAAFASKLLFDTVYQMLRDAHVALEPHHAGKHVVKSQAEATLVHPARLAGGLIESLTYAAQIPGGKVPAGVIHVLPVADNRWTQLRRVLNTMGSGETWPKVEKLGPWLAETVVPEFEWALGVERAEKARAVLDERAQASEAERLKVEHAKERAKLDAKKAREKAKLERARAEKRAVRAAKALTKLAASKAGAEGADADLAEPRSDTGV
jgi:hypothetical protein